MPRTNAAGEAIKSVTSLRFVRQHTTPNVTTTTAAVLGNGTETTIAVTSAAGFTAADECLIIGDGGVELCLIGTPATTMPVSPPPKIPQASGASFARGLSVSIGKFVQGSINWVANRPLTTVFEEIGTAALFQLPGNLDCGLSFGLFNHEGLNIQRLTGYEEAETGSGAAEATAYQTIIGVTGQAESSEIVFVLKMLRFDGKAFELQFCNCFFEAPLNPNPSRQNPAVLNATIKASILKIKRWTP